MASIRHVDKSWVVVLNYQGGLECRQPQECVLTMRGACYLYGGAVSPSCEQGLYCSHSRRGRQRAALEARSRDSILQKENGATEVWRVQSCNNTLHDFVQVLITISIRAFPSEGRTTWLRHYCNSVKLMMRIVPPLPPGTYRYAHSI
jgi:hypothetical protein